MSVQEEVITIDSDDDDASPSAGNSSNSMSFNPNNYADLLQRNRATT